MLRNSSERYGLVTKTLHWLLAMLILSLIGIGYYMVGLTYFDRWYNAALAWHKALGITVLALAVVFVGWKASSIAPAYPASLSAWQRSAATGMHHLLILLMLVIPISGYVVSTSAGKVVGIFNWFEIPALLPVSDALRDIAIRVHFWAAYGVGVLAAGHAAAALKHHFIDKDGILKRML